MGSRFYCKGHNFYLDDKKVFLNSGEIHYFRIKCELWDKHLEAAKEAGLTTVSTYIPWAWHEPDEGQFDLDGTTLPERDLKGWLERCQKHGLHCIVKPGPFILAETRGAGLPDWFLEQHADGVKMHNRKGEIVASDGVSLFHPIYQEKVKVWYDQIIPFISEREISKGGPVIMMQVCNEIGVFSWLAHQADYSDNVRNRFIKFLKNNFKDISELNRLWETNYSSFNEVELPPDGRDPFDSKGDRSRDQEWHLFWRTYYGAYLRRLATMARDRGVTVPFYHNLPGWIYGSGYEFPVNITMYEDLFRDKSEIIFGVDHIPEYVSYRNMHDDRIINDITGSMQGDKPLFAAEFQCGSREYHVVTNPKEMELFYKASIANGLTGWNYYMFSQGRNPRHRGYSGQTFYWFTPLSPEAERNSIFPLVQRMSQIIKSQENLIVNAERKAEVCVLFYPPYYATELERPESGASNLTFNYTAIRRPAYFDGLLKVLQVLNIDYDMVDHTQTSNEKIGKYKQVWAFSTDEMNARDQQMLVDYTQNGGNLVIFPNLPDREMSQNQCTIFRDVVGVQPKETESIDSPLVDVYDFKDIKCANPQIIYDENELKDAQIIARTIRGSVCGFEKTMRKGTVIHLGTWLGFDTEGHKPVYEYLLEKSGAKLRQAFSSNENITVRERFTQDKQAVLFVGNYYNEELFGTVTYTHPEIGENIQIPFSGEDILWPQLYSILTPVNLEITEGISILHCTSDILNIDKKEGEFEITLFGDRDLVGELVMEGAGIKKIREAHLFGKKLDFEIYKNRMVMKYDHLNKEEMKLNLLY